MTSTRDNLYERRYRREAEHPGGPGRVPRRAANAAGPRTYRKYEEVIELLVLCLNGYGHQHLYEADRER